MELQSRFSDKIILPLLIGISLSFLTSLFLLQLFTGILIFLWLLEKNHLKKKSIDPITILFLAFAAVRIISVFTSEYFEKSAESFYKDFLFYGSILPFSFYFKTLSREKIKKLFLWFIFYSAIVSLAGIAAFNLHYQERATSIFLGTSSYTNQLFTVLAILLFVFIPDDISKKRWYFYPALAAVISSGIILNLSRTDTVVALLIILSAFIIKRFKLKVIALFCAAAAVISLLSFYNNSAAAESRISNPYSMSDRDVIWQSGLDKIAEHPFLGFGPRTFNLVFNEYEQLRDKHVGSWHNDYLNITLESGFIGLALYLLLLCFVFYRGIYLQFKMDDKEKKYLILGLLAALGGMALSQATSGFVNNPNLSILFVFYLSAAGSFINKRKLEENENS